MFFFIFSTIFLYFYKYQNTYIFYWPTLTVFLINSCFSRSLINAKQKFWWMPHLLHMRVIFSINTSQKPAHKSSISEIWLAEGSKPLILLTLPPLLHFSKFRQKIFCINGGDELLGGYIKIGGCTLVTCQMKKAGVFFIIIAEYKQLKTFALKSFFFQFFKIKWMKKMHQHFLADVYGKLQWSCRQSHWQLPSANMNFMVWHQLSVLHWINHSLVSKIYLTDVHNIFVFQKLLICCVHISAD